MGSTLLYEELTILIAAFVATALISKKTGLPITALEIVAGIAVVSVFGFRLPADASIVVTFGSLLIVFLAGVETRFDFLKTYWKPALMIGVPGFVGPFLILFYVLRYPIGAPLFIALVGATALADTSISIVYTTLHQYDLAKLPFGRMVLAATLIVNLSEDSAITTATLGHLGVALLTVGLLAALTAATLLLPSLLTRVQARYGESFPNLSTRTLLLALAIMGLLTSIAVIPGILFVFVLGLLVSRHCSESSLEEVQKFAFALFVPLYFLNVGLNVNIGFVLANLPLLAGLVAVASAAKIASLLPGVRWTFGGQRSAAVVVLMNTRLTSATVILSLMLANGLISVGWYSLFISVVVTAALGSSAILRAFRAFESPEAAKSALGTGFLPRPVQQGGAPLHH